LELTWARVGSNAGSIDTTSPASCIPSLAEAQESREHFTGEARALGLTSDREKEEASQQSETHHSTSSSHEAPGPHLHTCVARHKVGYAGRITQLTFITDAIIHPANWHQMRYGWTNAGAFHGGVRQVRESIVSSGSNSDTSCGRRQFRAKFSTAGTRLIWRRPCELRVAEHGFVLRRRRWPLRAAYCEAARRDQFVAHRAGAVD
jgi:hypothetical protein